MKNFSEDKFLSDVSGICWGTLSQYTDNISTLVGDWSSMFSSVIGKYAPLKEMRVS